MTVPTTVLARLAEAGCRVTLRPDGRLSLQPPPPPELLALAKQHRDDLVTLLWTTTPARVPQKPTQAVGPGDPPPPTVPWEAARTLAALELAGARPALQRDGSIKLGYPKRAEPDLLADAARHDADLRALLRYRATLEAIRPADRPIDAPIAPPQSTPGRQSPPLPDLTNRLAAALMTQAAANPAVRITDEAKACGYFEGQATRQLLRTADPAEHAALVAAEEIRVGMPNGQRYSAASSARARAAWRVVQEHVPDKPEKACRAVINAWKDSGTVPVQAVAAEGQAG